MFLKLVFFKFNKKFYIILKISIKNKEVVLSGVEPESQVQETRMITITP